MSPGSTSAMVFEAPGAFPLRWRFALARDPAPSAYAAAQFPMDGGLADFDRVRLIVRATRPMRLWAQLRSPVTGARWGRTFYVDEVARDVTLPFDRFAPIGSTTGPPDLAGIDSLLVVVDTLNSRAGDSGELEIRELWRER